MILLHFTLWTRDMLHIDFCKLVKFAKQTIVLMDHFHKLAASYAVQMKQELDLILQDMKFRFSIQ